MTASILTVSYLSAGILFILSLGGLSSQESARRGAIFGLLGITIAVGATVFSEFVTSYRVMAVAMVGGVVLGSLMAHKVKMTAMPEMVALLNGFGGMAAVLVCMAFYQEAVGMLTKTEITIRNIEAILGVVIGGVTFSGSLVAFAKLRGLIGSRPMTLPGRHILNLSLICVAIWVGASFLNSLTVVDGMESLLVLLFIAFILGTHLVLAIGGADMPVVISMLNSYSGWAAAATGFMLGNDILIIVGALVGSSGTILTYIMCRAMNRSFLNVFLGGFGGEGNKIKHSGQKSNQEVVATSANEVAQLLKEAKKVIIVPGFGMAVAQAQHLVNELCQNLQKSGVDVRFAIHPVAGRMPGHMNVLLAEAKVSYDIVFAMDDINDDFANSDVALVIGANDTVNPGAQDDPQSVIYGMPVLEVWKAKATVVLKRSMATGYSGMENPLFSKQNSKLLFGDAKDSMEKIVSALK
ncbi:MAG: NAD(P)(+) transhydrogenase (Re/Si-specific) subunit beta [Magnetococcales bacterium]|nr:NAD(P)(+) transhydrogenase (Re/Si-specific) subunit beta [Magnetococcales bacterium]